MGAGVVRGKVGGGAITEGTGTGGGQSQSSPPIEMLMIGFGHLNPTLGDFGVGLGLDLFL